MTKECEQQVSDTPRTEDIRVLKALMAGVSPDEIKTTVSKEVLAQIVSSYRALMTTPMLQ